MYLRNVLLAALVPAMAAFAQSNPVSADAPFQVKYAAHLTAVTPGDDTPDATIGIDSVINITNTGANGAPFNGPGFGGATGNICVNVYAFDPGEELISCCSCLVTPDQTVSLAVDRDLTAKTLNGVAPSSVTVKLLSTLAGTGGSGTSCTNSAGTATIATLAAGMAAWGTSLHANISAGRADLTETAFTPATLSAGELASLTGRCTAILGNGSGFGVCNSCRAGALGGAALAQ